MTSVSTCSRQGCDNLTAGRFKTCAVCREYGRRKAAEFRSRQDDNNAGYQRLFHRRRRETVLSHYGGHCACCGEDRYEFLAIDHIDGGGEKHRAKVGQGTNMVAWIIANNFPPMFRVLCHNCNQSIGYYGVCPHESELRLVMGVA
jgi:hypothetical protein